MHKWFQLWERGGFFGQIWEAGRNKFDELDGIDWKWQSADGCQIKALLATEKNTFRDGNCRGQLDGLGKNGGESQRLRGGHGVPLSIVVCRANRHDSMMLKPLLAERFVSPDEDTALFLNLCLEAGYVGCKAVVEAASYVRDEEAFLSWLNPFVNSPPRCEKPTNPTTLSYISRLG